MAKKKKLNKHIAEDLRSTVAGTFNSLLGQSRIWSALLVGVLLGFGLGVYFLKEEGGDTQVIVLPATASSNLCTSCPCDCAPDAVQLSVLNLPQTVAE